MSKLRDAYKALQAMAPFLWSHGLLRLFTHYTGTPGDAYARQKPYDIAQQKTSDDRSLVFAYLLKILPRPTVSRASSVNTTPRR